MKLISPRWIPEIKITTIIKSFISIKKKDLIIKEYINKLKYIYKKEFIILFPMARYAIYATFCALFKKNSEIIVSAYNVPNCVIEYIKLAGMKIKYIDITTDSPHLNFNKLKQTITKKTKGVVITHLYGSSLTLDKVVKLCKKMNIILIEDAAQAFGIKTNDAKSYYGTFGDIGVFSTSTMKIFSTLIGGFIVTDNSSYYKSILDFKKSFKPRSLPKLLIKKLAFNIVFILLVSNKYFFSFLFHFLRSNINKINLHPHKTAPNDKQINLNLFEKNQAYIGLQNIKNVNKLINYYKNRCNQTAKLLGKKNTYKFTYHYFPVYRNNRTNKIKKLNTLGYDIGPGMFENYSDKQAINAVRATQSNINIPLHKGITKAALIKITTLLKNK